MALGVYANPAGIQHAERQVRLIRVQLAAKIFVWEAYAKTKPRLIRDWIQAFETAYFTRRSRTPKSETARKKHYYKVLKRLPVGAELTADLLLKAIAAT